MMRFLRYAWGALINLVAVLVVLIVFSRFHEPFEITTIAILGMLYVTVRSIGIGSAIYRMDFGKAVQVEFNDLRELQGLDPRDMQAAEETMRPLRGRLWIDVAFLTVIQLICMFKIIFPT
jgi:hypothetical protein